MGTSTSQNGGSRRILNALSLTKLHLCFGHGATGESLPLVIYRMFNRFFPSSTSSCYRMAGWMRWMRRSCRRRRDTRHAEPTETTARDLLDPRHQLYCWIGSRAKESFYAGSLLGATSACLNSHHRSGVTFGLIDAHYSHPK